jgi:hypothetical protein
MRQPSRKPAVHRAQPLARVSALVAKEVSGTVLEGS